MVNVFNILKNKSPGTKARLIEQMAGSEARRKKTNRAARKSHQKRTQVAGLGTAPFVYISKNYTNPVTLARPPLGVIVYKLKNRTTGHVNYYNAATIHKLSGKNNYGILVANAKAPLFRNPWTRGPVHPRNLQRVRLREAEAKIARHISKKKKARKSH